MRPALIRRAVAIASTTVAGSAAVALAFAPSRSPLREAVDWIARPAAPAMTHDPRASAIFDSSLENAPVAGTFCPIMARNTPAQSTSAVNQPAIEANSDSGAALLLGGSSRAPNADSASNCTLPAASSARPQRP